MNQGWEIKSLTDSYQRFKSELNKELGEDLFPDTPKAILEVTDNRHVALIEESIERMLNKNDDTMYFMFFQADLFNDYSFLHPENEKIRAMPVNKMDELYNLGLEALDLIKKVS